MLAWLDFSDESVSERGGGGCRGALGAVQRRPWRGQQSRSRSRSSRSSSSRSSSQQQHVARRTRSQGVPRAQDIQGTSPPFKYHTVARNDTVSPSLNHPTSTFFDDSALFVSDFINEAKCCKIITEPVLRTAKKHHHLAV